VAGNARNGRPLIGRVAAGASSQSGFPASREQTACDAARAMRRARVPAPANQTQEPTLARNRVHPSGLAKRVQLELDLCACARLGERTDLEDPNRSRSLRARLALLDEP
jgi:hypothetical protein